MSRGHVRGYFPPPPMWAEGGSLFALVVAGWAAGLATPAGRADLAATYRDHYRTGVVRLGWEEPVLLRAADALERCDWPTLGQLLRHVTEEHGRLGTIHDYPVEPERWRGMLGLAAALERTPVGADFTTDKGGIP